MASQGPNSPGTSADGGGSYPWSNPTYTLTSDNNRATRFPNTASNYLKATNFGFSIPVGATIDGIKVEIERSKAGAAGAVAKDHTVCIIKSDGTYGTTNKADTVTAWPSIASESYATYGGATDKWGETWAAGDINDADFGAAIKCSLTSGKPEPQAYVDHIRITVYYTEGASSGIKVAGGVAQASIKKMGGSIAEADIKKIGGVTN